MYHPPPPSSRCAIPRKIQSSDHFNEYHKCARGGLVTYKRWKMKTELETTEKKMSVVLQKTKAMPCMEPSCPGEFASTSLGKTTGTRLRCSTWRKAITSILPTLAWKKMLQRRWWTCRGFCVGRRTWKEPSPIQSVKKWNGQLSVWQHHGQPATPSKLCLIKVLPFTLYYHLKWDNEV